VRSCEEEKCENIMPRSSLSLGSPNCGSIFMFGNILRRAAARSAEGARSALRREAPVARGRAKLRRISSLSFCTLHHFSSLYHL
jgi:hypothetical protein